MTATTVPQQDQTPSARRVLLRDLCSLFCCPPLPSSIVAKLAFMPPEPSYRILTSDSGQTNLELIEGKTEWPYSRDELKNVDVLFARTQRRNKIACMFVRPHEELQHFTLLFSHGNAVDIGQMCGFYFGLGLRLRCNVFSYDYSGYGQSTGRPSEKNLYADITAALKSLESRYQIPPEQVILYGQSIGTVPSVDLASSNSRVAGLVLHSPLLSGMRVAFPEKIPRVQCPTLVIHGTDDDVIDFSHGVTIYQNCPTSVEPLWVSGAGHNDVELHAVYLERLRLFIESELRSPLASREQFKSAKKRQQQRDQTQNF
uniref:Serine aminopeptidase S33 domain-containing protein n=1 Tax=Globodera rostochiensis TaxID=31243 RepID=A0A914HU79_GLORO